jgi:hypothetical protein
VFFRRRPSVAEPPPDVPDPVVDDGPDVAEQATRLQTELAGIVRQANADGGRLPAGAVPTVRDIDDILRPLLGYVANRGASDEEMRALTAIVSEYLPTALGDFMALPPQYAERPGVTGSTPALDLVRQLQLLDEGANELQDLVYTGDAAQLAIQARFLDAKFRRSDLD